MNPVLHAALFDDACKQSGWIPFDQFMERALYYLENPQFGRKRLGRALGLVPPPRSESVADRVMAESKAQAAG